MSAVTAIAVVALRAAIRSRLWLVLTVMIVAIALGLPVTVKGDGTITGLCRIAITYTMWLTSLLISLASVWVGCGAIALEVRDRQMHQVLTKPVRTIEVWVGKWLALAVLSAALCAAAAAGSAVALSTAVRRGPWQAADLRVLREEILVARRALAPITPDVEQRVQQHIREATAAGRWPPEGEPAAEARRRLRDSLRASDHTVLPSSRGTWEIELPEHVRADGTAQLRFRFATSTLDTSKVAGRWSLLAESGAERWSLEGAWTPGAVHSLSVPASALAGSRRVRLVFENRDRLRGTLLFDPDEGIRLLIREGGAAGNFVRGWLVTWCQITVLGAVGLAAGSLLSMPVASFLAVAAVLVARMAGYVSTMAGQPVFVEDPTTARGWAAAAERIWQTYFSVMNWLLRPVRTTGVFERLAAGELISWAETLHMIAWSLPVGCGLLACLGATLLRVRELGGVQE
ncbi:MAG: hypothetical protein N2652_03820 [Kiritimatiellae bacterium]|nr:hypothetical protein [Kiritimatiellia bacterium]